MTAQDYYREHGNFVIASVSSLPAGLVEVNDWNEDDMSQYRWSVISTAEKEDLVAQNTEMGFANEIDRRYRFFYRVVALD